jgi:hypothetical protein
MTDIAQASAAQPPAHAAVWEDFIDIFYAPAAVFRRREQGSVLVPMLVVTVLCGTVFFLNSGALQPMFDAEFDRQIATVVRTNPNIPPEAMERMRSIGMRLQQIGMFIFMPIAMVCVGLATWLLGKLLEAKQSFRAAMVVAAYAYAPRILEQVLHGVQALLLDPAQLNGRFRVSLGPGRFLDPDVVSPLLLAVVGRLDVFTLWVTALIAIGLCVTGRIPRGRAAIAAAFVWVLGALPLIFGALRAM